MQKINNKSESVAQDGGAINSSERQSLFSKIANKKSLKKVKRDPESYENPDCLSEDEK